MACLHLRQTHHAYDGWHQVDNLNRQTIILFHHLNSHDAPPLIDNTYTASDIPALAKNQRLHLLSEQKTIYQTKTTIMASPSVLQTRLKDLSASLAHMHPLIARLWNFTTAIGQGDQARLELGAEIHTRLKEAEEEMELLRVEIEALEPIPENRRRGANNEEKEAERERVVSLAGRLEEDLKRWV